MYLQEGSFVYAQKLAGVDSGLYSLLFLVIFQICYMKFSHELYAGKTKVLTCTSFKYLWSIRTVWTWHFLLNEPVSEVWCVWNKVWVFDVRCVEFSIEMITISDTQNSMCNRNSILTPSLLCILNCHTYTIPLVCPKLHSISGFWSF